MSVETWGQMDKSQTDSEKVEAAIDRKIQAHDDDPDSHLDEGQMMQSHRASEIIDHLANSIVEDKIATGEISSRTITTNQIVAKDFRTSLNAGEEVDGVRFNSEGLQMWQGGVRKVSIPTSGNAEFSGTVRVNDLVYNKHILQFDGNSIDGFVQYGDSEFVSSPGFVSIFTDPSPTGIGQLSASSDYYLPLDFDSLSLYYETTMFMQGALIGKVRIGFGHTYISGNGDCGVGIDFDGGTLRCYVQGTNSALVTKTVPRRADEVYRWQIIQTAPRTFTFYLWGVQVAELSISSYYYTRYTYLTHFFYANQNGNDAILPVVSHTLLCQNYPRRPV